jgi:hypothetical protein
MSDRRRTVLHVSPHTAITESRTRALTSIGCHVVGVATVGAALFEISMGLCGILLLCHKLDQTSRCTLAAFFEHNCPEPYIVAVLAHEHDQYPPQAHARVIYSQDHGPLLKAIRQRLAVA